MDSSGSSPITGILLFKGGSITLESSVDVRVLLAWPLACARRVDFLFGSLNLALKCRYVLEVQERISRRVVLYVVLVPSRKYVDFLPRTYPNKIVHLGPPTSEDLPVSGAFDTDCGVLECCRESLTLHTRNQLLVPCPPRPHQPAESPLEVTYPVSLPGIGVSIWLSHRISIALLKAGRYILLIWMASSSLIVAMAGSGWRIKGYNRRKWLVIGISGTFWLLRVTSLALFFSRVPFLNFRWSTQPISMPGTCGTISQMSWDLKVLHVHCFYPSIISRTLRNQAVLRVGDPLRTR